MADKLGPDPRIMVRDPICRKCRKDPVNHTAWLCNKCSYKGTQWFRDEKKKKWKAKSNEDTGDPKCWLCATVTKPSKKYGPNICVGCWPDYSERKFVFVRASEDEIKELWPT